VTIIGTTEITNAIPIARLNQRALYGTLRNRRSELPNPAQTLTEPIAVKPKTQASNTTFVMKRSPVT
jgi:hypothetical protein